MYDSNNVMMLKISCIFIFNNFIKQMNKKQWGTRKKIQSKKLPRQQIQRITQRQYEKAVKHLQRINFNQFNKTMYTQPFDPQCTFEPEIYGRKKNVLQKDSTKDLTKYKNDDLPKTQQRLMQWGMQKSRKRMQNMLKEVVQVQKMKHQAHQKIVQKRKNTQYQSRSLFKTGQSQLSILLKNKFKSPSKITPRKKNQTTFMNTTHVKSKSSLLSRLVQ